jgi:hypothetical protein
MARTSFLFWNVNRQPVEGHLAALASHHDVDVLILCECEMEHGVLAGALNADILRAFEPVEGQSTFARLYSRLPFLAPLEDSRRLASWRLVLPGSEEVLLIVVHLRSRLHCEAADKQNEGVRIGRRIRELEDKVGHHRTILVGDFNMNPFEEGMIGTEGLHSVMSNAVARKGSRKVQGQEYLFFYNPMWGRFGDGSPGPCGTYYHDKGKDSCYYWNMFDQVLLRPELLDRFDVNRLCVPVSAGTASLVKDDGRPDRAGASDHLPIVFEFDL